MINLSMKRNYDKIAQEGKNYDSIAQKGRNYDKIVPRGMKGWLPAKKLRLVILNLVTQTCFWL